MKPGGTIPEGARRPFVEAAERVLRLAVGRGLINEGEAESTLAEMRQQLAPDSLDVAASLHNLGLVAQNRGELDRGRPKGAREAAPPLRWMAGPKLNSARMAGRLWWCIW